MTVLAKSEIQPGAEPDVPMRDIRQDGEFSPAVTLLGGVVMGALSTLLVLGVLLWG